MNKLAFFAILHWHPTRVTAREPPDSVKYFRDKDSLPACMKMKELGKRSETKTTTMISKRAGQEKRNQDNNDDKQSHRRSESASNKSKIL